MSFPSPSSAESKCGYSHASAPSPEWKAPPWGATATEREGAASTLSFGAAELCHDLQWASQLYKDAHLCPGEEVGSAPGSGE